MMNTRNRSTCALALLLSLLALPAVAQSLIGSIDGVVRDEQGGVLPGVTVTLAGKTGSKAAQTAADGRYRFPAVDAGQYALTAELAGFNQQKQENIWISIGQKLDFDFTLKVGVRGEELTVIGEAPVVDTTSSQTTTTLSQDILFNAPLNRFAPALLNAAPGINGGSAFGGGATGGGSSLANALLIDGVETRDPEGGTPWSFINYNVIDEVQIQGLGAPAEYGAFTGAIINSITKSGANQFSGLFDAIYTKDSLSSDNRTPEIRKANPTLEPSRTNKFLDWTAQIGGPIEQDKLFFFLSAQRYKLNQDPSGPRTFRDELSHRGDLKINWEPGTNDNLMFHLEFDDYSIRGRSDYDPTIDGDAQTDNEDAPEWIWNAQWRHLFGSNTFLETKYLGWWGYYYLDPITQGPRFYDGSTNTVSGSSGIKYYADRNRNEAHASLSHFAEAFGRHDLKFGVQVERSKVRSRYFYATGVNYYDYTAYYPVGQYYAYSYSYDFQARNRRESFFAQDSWKPTDRLTINAGLRYDWMRGNHPDAGKVYDTKSLAPRIGVAWDATGDHKTVLKGSYSQYYEALFATLYERGLPGGREDYIGYCYDGESQESGGPPGFFECERVPNRTYAVDPDIKHPRVDEFTVGFERALSHDVRLSVTGIFRDNKNFIDAVLPDARWTPISLTINREGTPLDGKSLNVFGWPNRNASQSKGLITNVDGFQYRDPDGNVVATAHAYRKYRGGMLVLSKRFSHRWQAQVSYVLSKTEGTIDNRSFGGNAGFSRTWESPNVGVVNTDGPTAGDVRHEIKAYATYQVPVIELGINASFLHLGGLRYAALVRFSSADRRALGLTFVPSAYRTIFAEQRGSRHLESQDLLVLRINKIFKLGNGKDKIEVYADIANVFNSSKVSGVRTRLEPTTLGSTTAATPLCPCEVPFDGPLNLIAPRQVTLGARWSF